MSFLPVDYEAPQSSGGGSYFKPQLGSNKLRILSDAIIGWEYWNNDNKPVRVRKQPQGLPNDLRAERDGKPGRIKHFWAVVIWNYDEQALQVWEITQASIRDALMNFNADPDWGHPKGYNITLNKEGKDLETKYTIVPSPNKNIPDAAINAWKEARINLEALFDSGNPLGFEGELPPGSAGSHNECRPVYLLYGMVQRANGEPTLLDKAKAWAMAPNQFSDIDAWASGDGIGFIDELCAVPSGDSFDDDDDFPF